MSLRTSVVAMLRAKSKVTDLVGERIYRERLPQNPALPAVTYMVVSGSTTNSFSGPSGLDEVTVQIDAWGSAIDADNLADAIRESIDGLVGQFGDCYFQEVTCMSPPTDVHEPDPHEEPIAHLTQDFMMSYEKVQ